MKRGTRVRRPAPLKALGVLLVSAVAGLALSGSASAAPLYVTGAGIDGPHLENPEIGWVLTAIPGTWQSTGTVSFQYTWLRDGVPVGEGATYTTGPPDVAQTVSLRITATDTTGSAVLDITYGRMVWPSPSWTHPATIVGTPQPGNTLTADTSGFFIPNPAQPGPMTSYINWALCPTGLPITCGTRIAGTDSSTTAITVTSDMVGKDIWLSYVATLPNGIGGEGRGETHTNVTVVAAPVLLPPPQLASTTNVSPGQTVSGTLRWTVQASGLAHSVKFYSDNTFIKEAVADANNWAIDLDTKQFTDGVHQFGYDIYNSAGQRVYVGHHIQVTVNNAVTPAPPSPPGGGGSGGGGGGSGGGTPTTPPAQTPPVTVPQPIPPKVNPPISKGGT